MRKTPFFLVGLLALFLEACTPGGQNPELPVSTQEAQQLWTNFSALSAIPPQPSRTDGSLRFGHQNDTSRVTYLLWSNGDLPLRLDIQAGAGMTAASIEVDGDMVLAYLPRDQKAYIGTDSPDKALSSLGLPMPLSVARLNSFIQGRYLEALGNPDVVSHTPSLHGNGTVFQVDGDYGPSTVELSAEARPVRWNFPGSWSVEVRYEGEGGLPSRLDALLPASAAASKGEDYKVVLLIKKRQIQPTYAPADLRLELPINTPVFDLDS